jgi:hypothetical protein
VPKRDLESLPSLDQRAEDAISPAEISFVQHTQSIHHPRSVFGRTLSCVGNSAPQSGRRLVECASRRSNSGNLNCYDPRHDIKGQLVAGHGPPSKKHNNVQQSLSLRPEKVARTSGSMLLPEVRPPLGTTEGVSCECAVTTGLFGNVISEPGGAFTHPFSFRFLYLWSKKKTLL